MRIWQGTRLGLSLATIFFALSAMPAAEGRTAHSRAAHRQTAGPHDAISASSASIIDLETGTVLFEKNSAQVLPIASITKLMVALTVLDSGVELDTPVHLTAEDDLASRGRRRSRLSTNTSLTRDELLRLMLMSSENKAAYALARSHPDGYHEFMRTMNIKAQYLGMFDTRFLEPTGLSEQNVSTARDLQKLLREAQGYPLIRDYSTRLQHQVTVGRSTLSYVNSNRLVRNGGWDIALQKTGTTNKAGKCVVALMNIRGRQVSVVLLNARGKQARIQDMRRLKAAIESGTVMSASNEQAYEFR